MPGLIFRAIRRVLWCDEERMWFDYDFLNRAPRKSFYPSNLFPLWAECFDAAEVRNYYLVGNF